MTGVSQPDVKKGIAMLLGASLRNGLGRPLVEVEESDAVTPPRCCSVKGVRAGGDELLLVAQELQPA